MAKKDDYVLKTENYANTLCEEFGFELYDVEYVKEGGMNYLRVFVDKEGGISVNECEVISRRMNTWLDEEDFIDDSYIFEVSSPGISRVLKKDKHFEKALGSEVRVKLFKAEDGKKEIVGFLDDFDEDTITIGFEDDSQKTINRSNVAKVNLEVHF